MLQLNLYILIAGLLLANALKFEDETNWQAYCNRKRQSPIDVVNDNTVNETNWDQRLRFRGYSKPLTWKIKNSGSHIKVKNFGKKEEDKIILRGGGLEGTYYAVSINVFWEKGSLHSLAGQFYSMEWQILHMKKEYQSMHEAITKPDGIAVLTFFANVSDSEDGPLEEFSKQIGLIRDYKELTDLPKNFSMSTLVNAVNPYQFYSYFGSITTPPCHESIYYMFFPKIIPISRKSFSYFEAILHLIHPNSKTAVRSLQKLNNRKIYFYNIMQSKTGTANITSTEPAIGTQPLSQQDAEFRGISSSKPESTAKEVNANVVKIPISGPDLPASSLNRAVIGSSTISPYDKSNGYTPSPKSALSPHHNNSISTETSSATPLIRDGSKPYVAPLGSSTNVPFGKSDDYPSSPGSSISPHQTNVIPPVTSSVTPITRDGSKPYGSLLDSNTNASFDKSNGHPSSQRSAVISPNSNNGIPPVTSSATPLIRDGSKPYGAPLGSSTIAPFSEMGDRYASSTGSALTPHQINGIPPISSSATPRDDRFKSIPRATQTHEKSLDQAAISSQPIPQTFHPNKINDKIDRGAFLSSPHLPPDDNNELRSKSWATLPNSHPTSPNFTTPYDKSDRYQASPGKNLDFDLPHSSPSIAKPYSPFDNNNGYLSKPGVAQPQNILNDYPSWPSSNAPRDTNVQYPSRAGTTLPFGQLYEHPSKESTSTPYVKRERYPSVNADNIPSSHQLYDHSSKTSTPTPYGKHEQYPSVIRDNIPSDHQVNSISMSNNSPFERNDDFLSTSTAAPPAHNVNNYHSRPSSFTMNNKDKGNPSMSGHSIIDDRGQRYPSALPFNQPSITTSTPHNNNVGYSSAPFGSISVSNNAPFKQSDGLAIQPELALPANNNDNRPNFYSTNNKNNGNPSMSGNSIGKTPHNTGDNYPSALPVSHPSVSTSTLPLQQYHNNFGYTSEPRATLPPSTVDDRSFWQSSPHETNNVHQEQPGHIPPYNQPFTASTPSSFVPEPSLPRRKVENQPSWPRSGTPQPDSNNQYPPGLPFDNPSIPLSSPTYNSNNYPSQRDSLPPKTFKEQHSWPSSDKPQGKNFEYSSKPGSTIPHEKSFVDRPSTLPGIDHRYTSGVAFVRPSISSSIPIAASSPPDNSVSNPSVKRVSIPHNKVDDHSTSLTPNEPHDNYHEYQSDPNLRYGQRSFVKATKSPDTGDQNTSGRPFLRPSHPTPSPLDISGDYQSAQGASPPNKEFGYTTKNHDDIYSSRTVHSLPYVQRNSQPSVPITTPQHDAGNRYSFGHPSFQTPSPLGNSDGPPSVSGAYLPPKRVKDQLSWHSSETPNDNDDEYPSTADYTNDNDDKPLVRSISTLNIHKQQNLSSLPVSRPSMLPTSLLNKSYDYPSIQGVSLPPKKVKRQPSWPNSEKPNAEFDDYPSKPRASRPHNKVHVHTSWTNRLKAKSNLPNEQTYVKSRLTPYGTDDHYTSEAPFAHASISNSSPRGVSDGYPFKQRATERPYRFKDNSSSPSYLTPINGDNEHYSKREPPLQYDQPSVGRTSIPLGKRIQNPSASPSISTSSPRGNSQGYVSMQGATERPKRFQDHSSSPSYYSALDEDYEYPSKHEPPLPYDQPSVVRTSKPPGKRIRNPSVSPSISTSSPRGNNQRYVPMQGATERPNRFQNHSSSPGYYPTLDEDYEYPSKHQPPPHLSYDEPSVVRTSIPPSQDNQNPSAGHSISTSSQRDNSQGYVSMQGATERPKRFQDHSSSPIDYPPLDEDYEYPSKHQPPLSYDEPSVVRTSIASGQDNQNPTAGPSISASSQRDKSQGHVTMPGATERPRRFQDHSSSPIDYPPLDEEYEYPSKHEPYESYDQPSVVRTSIPPSDQNPSGLPFDSSFTSTSSPLDRSDDYSSVKEDSIPPSSAVPHNTHDKSPSTDATLPYNPTSTESKSTQYNTDSRDTYNLRFNQYSISINLKLDNSDGYPSLPGVSLPPNKIDDHGSSLSSNKQQDEDNDYPSIPESSSPSGQSSVVRITNRPDTADRNAAGFPFGRPSSSPPLNHSDVYQYEPRASISHNKVNERNILPSSDVSHRKDDTFLSGPGQSLPYKQKLRQPSLTGIPSQYNKDGRYFSDLAFERPYISSSSAFDNNESYTSIAGGSRSPNKVNSYPSAPFYKTQYYDSYESQPTPRSTSIYEQLFREPSFASVISTPVT